MTSDPNMFHEMARLEREKETIKARSVIGQIARNFEAMEHQKAHYKETNHDGYIGDVIG